MFSGTEDFERVLGYESPITQIIGQLETQMEDEREQYDKGYDDGYTKAIDDFLEKIQWEYLNSCGIKQQEIDFLITVSSQVAEQLKEGAVDG